MYLTPQAIALFDSHKTEYAKNLGEPLPEPRWELYKQKLIDIKADDEFYLLVNLKEGAITWHYGIDKWLGYQKSQNCEQLFIPSLVHPFIWHYYYAFVIGMYASVLELSETVGFMSHRYKMTIPLRNQAGEFLCVQQISYPCAFDQNGRIVTYFNRYIINGAYIGQPLQPDIFIGNKRHDHLITLMYQKTASFLSIADDKLMFTRDELKVLKEAFKVSRFEGKRNEQMQKRLNMDIKHKNTRIKDKAKEMFLEPLKKITPPTPLSNFHTCLPKLDDIYMIAEFLHSSHIIPILEAKLRCV